MRKSRNIRVLNVDLSTKKVSVDEREDLEIYLGGIGIGIKLLDERINPTLDIFHPNQPIIFSIGPMETIYPVATKVAATFRSPLTEELGESYAGLRLGMAMRFAGYDAIVISGKSQRPIYLSIDSHHVEFRCGEALWGVDTDETGRLLREMEPGMGLRSIIRIGQSGEKMIRFAGVNVDTYRHFGRLGLGALFGSKLLKGIVIHGNGTMPVVNKTAFNKVYQQIYKKVTETDVMEKYHGIGTTINVLPLNEMNSLPTKNLQESSFEFAKEISGEAFAEEKLIRKMACSGCPIGCIHIGEYREKFGEPHEYTYKGVSYDHELVFAVGSFLGVNNKNDILRMIDKIEKYGLDCITTGVLLGWITEAYEKGIVTEEQLGLKIAFGEVKGYLQIIDGIIKQYNEFYQELAKGTHYVSSKYGGTNFAAILGKHEIAGYHTGYGNLLGMSVGARHSHLDNGGYSIDQGLERLDKDKIVDQLINEELERNIQNCLTICLFARKVYDFETITTALNALGIEKTKEDLILLGKEIFRMKVGLKKKLGFRYEQLRFPHRFFETETLHGKLNKKMAEELLENYIQRMEALCKETVDLFAHSSKEKNLSTYI